MTPEEQLANYYDYMSKLAYTSYFILVVRLVRDFIVDKKKREIGRYVHKQTLEKVLLAPVNLFFDVTERTVFKIRFFTLPISYIDFLDVVFLLASLFKKQEFGSFS